MSKENWTPNESEMTALVAALVKAMPPCANDDPRFLTGIGGDPFLPMDHPCRDIKNAKGQY